MFKAYMSFVPFIVLGIEILGSLVIIFAVMQAWSFSIKRQCERARILVAEGAVNGLSFKLGAALLKTLYLHTWTQIGMLFTIVALRTLMKMLFIWQQNRETL
jgi:uncharacterized membrane protein